jgi:hypothetical protein
MINGTVYLKMMTGSLILSKIDEYFPPTLITKMLVKMMIMLFRVKAEPLSPLGRWGYHWEKPMLHQKYYD